MSTLLLARSEVEKLVDADELYLDLKDAFRAYSKSSARYGMRVRSPLKIENSSAVVLFPGLSEGIPAYTIKNHSKFPGTSPAIKGVIHLHDLETGELLAIMDSAYITSVRTGLAGAMGTHLLARKGAEKVAIIGAGVQGRLQLESLSNLRDLKEVFIFDQNEMNARKMVTVLQNRMDSAFHISNNLHAAVSDADIIITATWSKEPFLFSDMVKKGVHITTLGPDEPNKAEVSAELIKQSMFVCDDRELAVSMGAIGGAGLSADSIAAEIGEVIDNQYLGRISDDQITIFGMVGLPFQDLVAAWHVYQKAKELNVGKRIDLFQ